MTGVDGNSATKCRDMEKDKTDAKKAFCILKEMTGKRSARSNVINYKEGRGLTESGDQAKEMGGPLSKWHAARLFKYLIWWVRVSV